MQQYCVPATFQEKSPGMEGGVSLGVNTKPRWLHSHYSQLELQEQAKDGMWNT